MTILRKHSKARYTNIDNTLLEAEGLSFRAKGIAAYLLSKPDDWVVRIDHLMKIAKEGEKAITTALHELAEYGFLMRERVHENGQVRTLTHIADYPLFADQGTVKDRIYGYKVPDTAISAPLISAADSSETPISDTAISDPPISEGSETEGSGTGGSLISTDLPITDLPIPEEGEASPLAMHALSAPTLAPNAKASLPFSKKGKQLSRTAESRTEPAVSDKDQSTAQAARTPSSPSSAAPPSSPSAQRDPYGAVYFEVFGLHLSGEGRQLLQRQQPEARNWILACRAWKACGYNKTNVADILHLAFDPDRARYKLDHPEKKIAQTKTRSYHVEPREPSGCQPVTVAVDEAPVKLKPLDQEADLFACIDEKWIVLGPKRGQVREALRRGMSYDALRELIDNASQFAEVLAGLAQRRDPSGGRPVPLEVTA